MRRVWPPGQVGLRAALSSLTACRPRPSWDRRHPPQGDEKKQAVREMFDAIAPRYDLVNRVMTFRLDVRWRRRTVRELRTAGRSTVLDLASRHRRPVHRLRKAGHRADLGRPLLRDARRRPTRRTARSGRHPATAGARRVGRRRDVRVRAAQPRRPGGSSTSWLGSCDRAAGSRCSTSAIPSNRFIRWGNDIYFGKVVPKIGALLSDGAAYRYLPKSVAYLPKRRTRWCRSPGSGFSPASCIRPVGGIDTVADATRR